ncbi:hypothetical protein VUR80DRAFT_363 [Thermomyces stellatus]
MSSPRVLARRLRFGLWLRTDASVPITLSRYLAQEKTDDDKGSVPSKCRRPCVRDAEAGRLANPADVCTTASLGTPTTPVSRHILHAAGAGFISKISTRELNNVFFKGIEVRPAALNRSRFGKEIASECMGDLPWAGSMTKWWSQPGRTSPRLCAVVPPPPLLRWPDLSWAGLTSPVRIRRLGVPAPKMESKVIRRR